MYPGDRNNATEFYFLTETFAVICRYSPRHLSADIHRTIASICQYSPARAVAPPPCVGRRPRELPIFCHRRAICRSIAASWLRRNSIVVAQYRRHGRLQNRRNQIPRAQIRGGIAYVQWLLEPLEFRQPAPTAATPVGNDDGRKGLAAKRNNQAPGSMNGEEGAPCG